MAIVPDKSLNSPLAGQSESARRKTDTSMKVQSFYDLQSGVSTSANTKFGPFPMGVDRVRIVSTSDIYYEVNAGVTATVSANFLPSDVVEYVDVQGNDYLNVVGTATGTAHVRAGR